MTLVLDGAMGTELTNRGVQTKLLCGRLSLIFPIHF